MREEYTGILREFRTGVAEVNRYTGRRRIPKKTENAYTGAFVSFFSYGRYKEGDFVVHDALDIRILQRRPKSKIKIECHPPIYRAFIAVDGGEREVDID